MSLSGGLPLLQTDIDLNNSAVHGLFFQLHVRSAGHCSPLFCGTKGNQMRQVVSNFCPLPHSNNNQPINLWFARRTRKLFSKGEVTQIFTKKLLCNVGRSFEKNCPVSHRDRLHIQQRHRRLGRSNVRSNMKQILLIHTPNMTMSKPRFYWANGSNYDTPIDFFHQ